MRVHLKALLIVLVSTACTVHAEQPEEYKDAKFSFSSEPIKAILTVNTSGMDMTQQSIILYGDGRLELKDNRYGTWERHLEFHEVQAILTTAVSYGLAEWDSETVLARQLQKYGRPFPGVTDGMRVRVLLSLESYERGSYKPPGSVFRSISVQAPRKLVEYFPEIHQFEGTARMVSWMYSQIKAARQEQESEQ